jgi:hypothetical protein
MSQRSDSALIFGGRAAVKRLVVAAVCLALAGIIAACGGGDGGGDVSSDGGGKLTLAQYFPEVERVVGEVRAGLDSAQEQFPAGFVEPGPTRDALKVMGATLESGVTELGGLNPPDEALEAHNEFVDAIDAEREFLAGLEKEVSDVESAAELQEVLGRNNAELDALDQRFQAACLALEAVATDNGIPEGLECGR